MGDIKAVLGQGWVGGALGVAGLVVALVSMVLAYYFYKKSLRQPKLQHYTHGFQVAGGPRLHEVGDNLEVLYRGEPVQRLDISWIAIWNGGTGTLDGASLLGSDPLRIEAPEDCDLLEAGIIQSTRSATGFRIAVLKERRSVSLMFDFLDPGDGVLIKLLHASGTGSSPEVKGVLKGTAVGAIRPARMDELRYSRGYSQLQNGLWLFMAFFFLLVAVLPDSVHMYLNSRVPAFEADGRFSTLMRVTYLVMGLLQLGFWVIWRRERIPPVPVALRTPEDSSAGSPEVAARRFLRAAARAMRYVG